MAIHLRNDRLEYSFREQAYTAAKLVSPRVHHSAHRAAPYAQRSQHLLSTTYCRTVTHAQRRRQEDYDNVELDDEYAEVGFNLNYLPLTGGRVLRTVQTLSNRFVDVVYDLAPAGTSRSVVETTAKGALLLVTLSFASSIVSFLLNAGFIVLALYIATKVFGINVGSSSSSEQGRRGPGPFQGDHGSQRKSNSNARQRGRQNQFKTGLGRAAGDLTDVWFERKPNKQKPR